MLLIVKIPKGYSYNYNLWLVAWRSGLRASSNQRSYSTSGPVSTMMGDCLRAGKPSRYKASQLGRLSLLPSMGW